MSYDVSAMSRKLSVLLPPHSSDARVPQNDGLECVQGPTLTSAMFPSNGNNFIFPPTDDEAIKYTYATFTREQYAPIPNEFSEFWELVVPIQIPADFNVPKLLSLEYTLKYASARDRGNSTLQSDIVLTTGSPILPGVRKLKEQDHEVYRDMETGYSPRMVRKNLAWNLLTSFGVKPKGGQEWSHYIDHQRISLGIPLAPHTDSTYLYFILTVQEYPSPETVRSIAVEIASKWEDHEIARPQIVRSPPPPTFRPRSQQSVRSLTASEEDFNFFSDRPARPPMPAPPQRPQPVDIPLQVLRPETYPSRCAPQLLYERCYKPFSEPCQEDIEDSELPIG